MDKNSRACKREGRGGGRARASAAERDRAARGCGAAAGTALMGHGLAGTISSHPAPLAQPDIRAKGCTIARRRHMAATPLRPQCSVRWVGDAGQACYIDRRVRLPDQGPGRSRWGSALQMVTVSTHPHLHLPAAADCRAHSPHPAPHPTNNPICYAEAPPPIVPNPARRRRAGTRRRCLAGQPRRPPLRRCSAANGPTHVPLRRPCGGGGPAGARGGCGGGWAGGSARRALARPAALRLAPGRGLAGLGLGVEWRFEGWAARCRGAPNSGGAASRGSAPLAAALTHHPLPPISQAEEWGVDVKGRPYAFKAFYNSAVSLALGRRLCFDRLCGGGLARNCFLC